MSYDKEGRLGKNRVVIQEKENVRQTKGDPTFEQNEKQSGLVFMAGKAEVKVLGRPGC